MVREIPPTFPAPPGWAAGDGLLASTGPVGFGLGFGVALDPDGGEAGVLGA